MWEFFQAVFEKTGPAGLLVVALTLLLAGALWLYHKKDLHADKLQEKLLEVNYKRVDDVIEDREKYIELSKELEVTIKTLIAVYQRNGSSSG